MKRRSLLSLPLMSAMSLKAAPPATVLTRVDTALGRFDIAVDPGVAPVTVANYLAYVDRHLLDGGSVYRIVTPANQPNSAWKIDVIQWGLNTPDDQPAPLPRIAHETTATTGLMHRDGTVSMARNEPGTASSEFFICLGDQPELDFGGRRNPDGQGFAAFGQVVSGMDVVRAIFARGGADQMLESPIAVRTVRRVQAPTKNGSAR